VPPAGRTGPAGATPPAGSNGGTGPLNGSEPPGWTAESEPTSALDPELVGEVLDVMKGLARSGMTMIVITHEMGFAREVAYSFVFMHAGVVVESGNPREVLADPQH